VAHFLACLSSLPSLRAKPILKWSLVAPVLQLGGWMTISNLISPIMVYMDRFLIGALMSVQAVGYYSVPFDAVTQLLVIPGSIASVLFPAFAATQSGNGSRSEILLSRGITYIFVIMFPLFLVAVAFAPEILSLWLGSDFAMNSTAVMRWLA